MLKVICDGVAPRQLPVLRRKMVALSIAFICTMLSYAHGHAQDVAVTTYHYDNARTGWNDQETVLNYANVQGPRFRPLFTVPVDGLVFAQPLVVPNVVVWGDPNPGSHDVVYVASYNNTIYAIDPTRGTIVGQRTLDPPRADACKGYGIDGINGTPVIDLAAKTMYIVDYTSASGGPAYYLHAISIETLADVVPPRLISASQTLTDGSTSDFDAAYTRQRTGLALVNGNVYAAFAAACEDRTGGKAARSWMLGWRGRTLRPLPFAELTDRLATDSNNYFHTSIWMSGAGLAADGQGSIYFLTGNSDRNGASYDSTSNLSESAIKVSGRTGEVIDFFTPHDVVDWEQHDRDFSSGGITLLPPISGRPQLAVAAGKTGTLYLLNTDNMGGFVPGGPDNVLAQYPIGNCFCTESTFVKGGRTYVVGSGGNILNLLEIGVDDPNATVFKPIASSSPLPVGRWPSGYFTTISSNNGYEPIIWTVSRSPNHTTPMTLLAYRGLPKDGGADLPMLYSAPVGAWSFKLNSNITPVVANGKVYVAGDSQVMIFGLAP